ncbi:MAG: hypothetical protein MZV70_46145 [Desulfobacterales bacterium]|nr:hypothetical protein [Desulfobacterales bacterium]
MVLEEDRHGQLGKIIAGEKIDGTALHHLFGRAEAVAEKPAAIGYDNLCVFSGMINVHIHLPLLSFKNR